MNRKLLLAILKVHDFTIDKAKVAEELSTEDQLCTSMAIQKRLQAINKMIKDGTSGESAPKAKATPRKRGASGTAADDESPTKKGKTGKGKTAKAKVVGTEDDGSDGAEQVMVKEETVEGDEFE